MKILLKITLIVFTVFLLPNFVFAYEKHNSIIVKNIQATTGNPYIIEGYEITNPTGDCINVYKSKNIIIRNNYLHNCGTDKKFQENTDNYKEGYATLIGNSSKINFENNILKENYRGFMAYNTENLVAKNNQIEHTFQYSSLWCERCSNSEFSFNNLADNGNPKIFWVSGDRNIGIWIKRSKDIKIHDNKIIRSSSDGIAITGFIYTPSFTAEEYKNRSHPQADWTGLSENIQIYNNIILDNMEQGVWLGSVRNAKVYNNIIRTGCFTYGQPVFTEFNVGNSEIYENKFLGCLNDIVGGAYSFNNFIYNNTYYTTDQKQGHFISFDDSTGVANLAIEQGAEYQKSYGNKEKNNKWLRVGGKLAKQLIEKKQYAEIHKTYQRKNIQGEQGLSPERLIFNPLMENFDDFVIEESQISKIKKFQLILLFCFILLLSGVFGYKIFHKRSRRGEINPPWRNE